MSRKTSNYIKIIPKSSEVFNRNQRKLKTSTNVKNELEARFEIDFNLINSHLSNVENKSLNSVKIRNCKVILKDISKNIKNSSIEIIKSETFLPEIEEDSNESSKATQKPTKSEENEEKSLPASSFKVHPQPLQDLPIGCQFCDQRFSSIFWMRRHTTKNHQKEINQKVYECDFDGKVFKSRASFRKHLRVHKSKVKCQLCQKWLMPIYLQAHIRDIHATRVKLQCKICLKYYKTKQILGRHTKTHDKKFSCKMCSKVFALKPTLRRHIRFFHENPGSFKCEICGFKFNENGDLIKHQKTHNKNRPKPYKCQKCDYSTDRNFCYKAHLIYHENEDKRFAATKNPLKCEKCFKFAKNKELLTQHMKLVHPEIPFQCDLCGRYFRAKCSLNGHISNRVCQKVKSGA